MISTDPRILAGKPAVRGTRLSVALVQEELAPCRRYSDDEIRGFLEADALPPAVVELLAAHPELSLSDVVACLLFSNRGLHIGPRGRTEH
jgi:uncharacterized protein (DUF433 family)